MSAALEKHFDGIDITDLWIPYFCVVTNVTDARVEYIDRGPLASAIRASISIPGVLPPVPREGRLYVDGGTLDNVPVEEMRRRNPHGTVIAIDVSPDDGPRAPDDYGHAVSGLQALRARRRGGGPPSLMSTMMRSSLVAGSSARGSPICTSSCRSTAPTRSTSRSPTA
jgi:predicted acylesterase/phospholipase RssA